MPKGNYYLHKWLDGWSLTVYKTHLCGRPTGEEKVCGQPASVHGIRGGMVAHPFVMGKTI